MVQGANFPATGLWEISKAARPPETAQAEEREPTPRRLALAGAERLPGPMHMLRRVECSAALGLLHGMIGERVQIVVSLPGMPTAPWLEFHIGRHACRLIEPLDGPG